MHGYDQRTAVAYGLPWPPTAQNAMASLDPYSLEKYASDPDVKWQRESVYEPRPLFPINDFIGKQPRLRPILTLASLEVRIRLLLAARGETPNHRCCARSTFHHG